MTVKELIRRLVDLPVDVEEATITFQDGNLVITYKSPDSGDAGCYLLE